MYTENYWKNVSNIVDRMNFQNGELALTDAFFQQQQKSGRK